MADFSIDPEFQEQLDWIREFVKENVESLDLAFQGEESTYDKGGLFYDEAIRPLQQKVKDRGLWSCHLTPEYGGQGYGQVRLAYMNEILGRSQFAPTVFGTQAPDSGNAEIIAHYGTDEQKATYLQPLLDGHISSCYSMTEPQGGADPGVFRCRAVRDGDEWVIDGEKWFSSSLRYASFLVVMCVTDPDVSIHKGASMFLVPADTPGIEVVRNVGVGQEPEGHGSHAYVRYNSVRVPAENLLGGEGQAFNVAQTRLGGGRLHHAMRTVGAVGRCLDMLCERALSRTTQGELLAQEADDPGEGRRRLDGAALLPAPGALRGVEGRPGRRPRRPARDRRGEGRHPAGVPRGRAAHHAAPRCRWARRTRCPWPTC